MGISYMPMISAARNTSSQVISMKDTWCSLFGSGYSRMARSWALLEQETKAAAISPSGFNTFSVRSNPRTSVNIFVVPAALGPYNSTWSNRYTCIPFRPSGQGLGLSRPSPSPICFFSAYNSNRWPGRSFKTRPFATIIEFAFRDPFNVKTIILQLPHKLIHVSSRVSLIAGIIYSR